MCSVFARPEKGRRVRGGGGRERERGREGEREREEGEQGMGRKARTSDAGIHESVLKRTGHVELRKRITLEE